MAGRIRFSFHTRVFFTVLAICWLFVGVFMIFLYQREKNFKTSLLDTRLQMHNERIADDLRHGEDVKDIIDRVKPPLDNLRVTLIDVNGNVVYDNNDKTPFPTANHNTRPEVMDARKNGTGHAVERLSESDDVSYFYSATLLNDGNVVRSAVPYNHNLVDFLKADRSLLWFMAALTILMSLIAYMAMRKISTSISRLNRFAQKAQSGGHIYNEEAFPNDELGSIASNIVKLYVQRDKQHREALRLEQDKIRLKKQLTNNINHELKTPVASIQICLDLLNDHPELDAVRKEEFMSKIRANVQRLAALLKDVSTITRMDDGSDVIQKNKVDLTAIVRDLVDEARLRTDIDIMLDMPELSIVGNSFLLESLFRNLIDNAIAYSGATELRITADNDGNFIVSDNGCGIAGEHLPHIFERFYRIDKGRSRAAGGTGLGLSIVRNAVAIHGGQITAESIKGLTFRFNLAVSQ